MKIYTLNIIIDADGNIVHTEETTKNLTLDNRKKDEPGNAIEATTLEDMIMMSLNDDVARA